MKRQIWLAAMPVLALSLATAQLPTPSLHSSEMTDATNSPWSDRMLDRILQNPERSLFTTVLKKRLDSLVTTDIQQPEIRSRSAFSYTSNDQNAKSWEEIYSEWSKQDGNWTTLYKTQYAYGPNGRLSQQLVQNYNGNSWVNASRIDLSYLANDNPKVLYFFNWNTSGQQWRASAKDTLVYQGSDLLDHTEYQTWDDVKKIWRQAYRKELEYNAKKEVSARTTSIWDQQANNYVLNTREEYSYHPHGKLHELIQMSWDAFIGDWMNMYRFTDLYDVRLRPSTLLKQRFNGLSWVENEKSEISYDNADNPIRKVRFLWDERLNLHIATFETENLYDNAAGFDELLLPLSLHAEFAGDFNPQLARTNLYTIRSGTRINDKVLFYYYSDLITVANQEDKTLPVNLHPNPASDQVQITGLEDEANLQFSLYNLLGEEVLKKETVSSSPIAVGHLPKGPYLYKIQSRHGPRSGKLILH